jgi:hypothetical protein
MRVQLLSLVCILIACSASANSIKLVKSSAILMPQTVKGAEGMDLRAAQVFRDKVKERTGYLIATYQTGMKTSLVFCIGRPTVNAATAKWLRSQPVEKRDRLLKDRKPGGFSIAVSKQHETTWVYVWGVDPIGTLHGIGALLTQVRFHKDGTAQIEPKQVVADPAMPMRGVHFGYHGHNCFQEWNIEQWRTYLEDSALFGLNSVLTFYQPGTADIGDPFDKDNAEGRRAWKMIHELFTLAKNMGMSTVSLEYMNFIVPGDKPGQAAHPDTKFAEIAATWVNGGKDMDMYGKPRVCPSVPRGRKAILDLQRKIWSGRTAEQLASIDWIMPHPFDEGGCLCKKCYPYSVTFIDLAKELTDIVREYKPGIKVMLDLRGMNCDDDSKLDSFHIKHMIDYVAAHPDSLNWCDAFQFRPENVAAVDKLPTKPIQVVGYKVVRNGWMGFLGANVYTTRIADFVIDAYNRGIRDGVYPYTEGIFSDLNNVVSTSIAYDPQKPASEVVFNYCRFYFGEEAAPIAAKLINLINDDTKDFDSWVPVLDLERNKRMVELAKAAEDEMPDWATRSWRWQIIAARAHLGCQAAQWLVRAKEASTLPPAKRTSAMEELNRELDRLEAASNMVVARWYQNKPRNYRVQDAAKWRPRMMEAAGITGEPRTATN